MAASAATCELEPISPWIATLDAAFGCGGWLKQNPSQRNRINRAIEELGTTCVANPATYQMQALQPAEQRLWRKRSPGSFEERRSMLWTITVVLFILWLLGVVSGHTFGSWIHILLVLALIVLIFNLLSGRRAL
jgi:Flp pilus assembly protein TadB